MNSRIPLLAVLITAYFGSAELTSHAAPEITGTADTAFMASDANVQIAPTDQTELSIRRASDGLFHVAALINGKPIDLAIDTGATRTVIAPADANRLKLRPGAGNYSKIETLNGRIRLQRATLATISLGNQDVHGLEVALGPKTLRQSVAGLDLIGRSGPLLIEGDRLTLLPPEH